MARGVVASILSLVYRAKQFDTNDNSWNITTIILCIVVENGVAIIVSCTPGFAKFTMVYMTDLAIIKSLRSTFGLRENGSSDQEKPSRENPNRPRTEREARRHASDDLEALGDTFASSATSTQRGELESNESLQHPAELEVGAGGHRGVSVI